ncbi:DExH-box splicing factor binding site-domain-containing protein [Durotheca rogersii]|uniref:DExH-box splicing factor binding site-domain-containing protein n=1 Tax=Durotheca rogersii TaxID=419775 RepID=UPI00222041BE|nr:DExH-box splicing factor binding site-domain-containing protein [Durotheca rogersii]KAI5860556.1 DExH-box splicing factor binding site-domain-containing protein [Durotheca rogersii]
MSEPARRIAIKFGAPSSSRSSNGVKKHARPPLPSTLGKRHRSHALNHDSDSESDGQTSGRHETVTTIGEDWSESKAKEHATSSGKSRSADVPYVISGHQNRDWKAEVKAQRTGKGAVPRHAHANPSASLERHAADQDKEIKWGLNVVKKSERDDINSSNETVPSLALGPETSPQGGDRGESKDEERDAMDALLGRKRKSAAELIIESTPRRDTVAAPSEQDVYRRRMEEAAEISTIDEYSQIPEGEFGAAMLRGMGWNGEERGSKPKEAKKRPHLMGLGSKEDEEIRKGELARKHGHRERRPRLDEYRRDKERERRDREERRGDSYKSERERERRDPSHSHGHRDRDRDRTAGHGRAERGHRY